MSMDGVSSDHAEQKVRKFYILKVDENDINMIYKVITNDVSFLFPLWYGCQEDILYKFPKQDSILSELRGLYYTLTHLLTDDNVANSTL